MQVFKDPQSRAYARITGVAYLVIAAAGFFSILYVPGQLFVPGDGAASLTAINARRGLFNLGVAGDVAVILAELVATTMLYFMFAPVNKTLSFAAAMARLMMVAVMAVMLFFYAGTLMLAGPDLVHLDNGTRGDLAALMLHLHDQGVVIWQLFFFIHLIILGQLVARSGAYPRLLGHAMSLGSFGYIGDSLIKFADDQAGLQITIVSILLGIVSLAEIGFALWLLIRGPRTR